MICWESTDQISCSFQGRQKTEQLIVRFSVIYLTGQIANKLDCPVKNQTPGNPTSECRRPSGYWYLTFRPQRRCSVSYTGYRYASTSTSRLQRSFIGCCLAFHHLTLPSWRLVADACKRRLCSRATKHALWRRHTAPSAIEHVQLLDPDYGTVFHHTWKRRTTIQQIPAVAKDIFVWIVRLRHSVTSAQCELF